MSLFQKSNSMKFSLVPDTPESTSARSYIYGLMQNDLNFPAETVADFTPTEWQVQGQLPGYTVSNQADYNQGRSYLNDILAGKYNPNSDDYYQGTKTALETLKAKDQLSVRRQAQQAGMGLSTRSYGAQAKVGQYYDKQILNTLAGRYEDRRDEKDIASQQLGQLNALAVLNAGNVQNLAAIERQKEQLQLTSLYNAAIKTLLAPFETELFKGNASQAKTLLNEQRYGGYQTGGGATDLAVMSAFTVDMLKSMFAAQ